MDDESGDDHKDERKRKHGAVSETDSNAVIR